MTIKTLHHTPLLLTLLAICFSCCRPAVDFTPEEREIINEADSIMRVLTIEDSLDMKVLRASSRDLSAEMLLSDDFKRLAHLMTATVTHPSQDGVGIAGPQVGLNRRVVAVQRFDKEGKPFEVYPNIRIIRASDSLATGPEGCLSVPGRRGLVPRSTSIIIEYTDLEALQKMCGSACEERQGMCCEAECSSGCGCERTAEHKSGCCPKRSCGCERTAEHKSGCCPKRSCGCERTAERKSGCCPKRSCGCERTAERKSGCCPKRGCGCERTAERKSGCEGTAERKSGCCPKRSCGCEDRDGSERGRNSRLPAITDTITGFTAVIFQHEIDHLDGILYTDRIPDGFPTDH